MGRCAATCPKQRGTHPGPDGTHAVLIDGILYPASLPPGFEDLDPIEAEMKDEVRSRTERRHQARQGRGRQRPCPPRRVATDRLTGSVRFSVDLALAHRFSSHSGDSAFECVGLWRG
ncbi:hypothetical protein C5613_09650 [Rhodococcus opacus]|uniref:Uncharacterized protein n=1 Tax=Rhodococcus opacus TaxID=37919 RepID=A0A2S8JDI2_RHOOP|nr:hypothetical protein C5613_09650 [Rhodococcus opacus]